MKDTVQFSNSPKIFEAAKRLFLEVQGRIQDVLPAAEIEHIGSTAIPGSLTKGDLDVLVRVDREGFRHADEILSRMFDRNSGSERSAVFSAFEDKSTSPDLGVQLTVAGSEVDFFVTWKDQLLSDKELLAAYDALKTKHQGRFMSDYRAAKNQFIKSNLKVNE